MRWSDLFDKENGTRTGLPFTSHLDDSDRNILHDLRFEACENNETCSRDTGFDAVTHLDTCPAHPDYDEED